MTNRYLLVLILSLFVTLNTVAQKTDSLQNAISFVYSYHHFTRQFPDDWHLGSVEYKRQTAMGAILARVNHASRLNRNGFQYEVDAYPKLSQNVYAYLNFGYSNKAPVFPNWRSGVSVYVSLPKGWEAEGGFRHLYFDQNIWMGTAGLSKYEGDWLFSLRSFFRPGAAGSSQSYFASARRYLKDEKDFVWVQAGRGISPDENRNVQLNASQRLASTKIAAGTQISLSSRSQLLFSASWSRDEFLPDTYGNQYFSSLGINRRF